MTKQQAQQISRLDRYQAIKHTYTYEIFCAEMAAEMTGDTEKHANPGVTAGDVSKYQSARKAYEALMLIASLA